MILIAANVAKRLPPNANAETIRKTLQSTRINGVSGAISFNAEGDVDYAAEAAIFRNGVPVPLELAK